ncbi:MAG: PHP domain-containing protein [Thermoleophilia bacterium]|nr:PHP domain-containing protein [Thermoleophilia bacterium]
MRIDTHVHTSPGSRCSQMSIKEYLKATNDIGLSTICVTNHGEIGDYEILRASAPAGLHVIPGVEISSPDGDFLVFSTDMAFLGSLNAVQALPGRSARPPDTAVVWAHPFAGNPGGAGASKEYIRGIAGGVDGIEVFNGNWPDEEASALARSIAHENGLAELGGSDSHRLDSLMRCHSIFTRKITNAAELVAAIMDRQTVAARALKKG